MKRILIAGVLLLMLASLSGCILLVGDWTKDVTYLVDLNASFAQVKITYTNENGDTVIVTQTGNFQTTFPVTVSKSQPFLAFVQAQVTIPDPLFLTDLQVAIEVDGRQKAYNEQLAVSPTTSASFLVEPTN